MDVNNLLMPNSLSFDPNACSSSICIVQWVNLGRKNIKLIVYVLSTEGLTIAGGSKVCWESQAHLQYLLFARNLGERSYYTGREEHGR